MTLSYGSLFTGIGGLDLGLDRAGMRCSWQVEIDPFCQKVLEKHWPNVERFTDVRQCGKHNLQPVDLICGGFPCQPHSTAGERKAGADERDLWGEFARVVCELRPKWVLAENVEGLLSSDDGRFFGGILRDLAACGYDAEWQVLSAAAFGAPHIRERVFILAWNVAHSKSNRWGFLRAENHRAPGSESDAPSNGGQILAGLAEWATANIRQWNTEPDLARVVDGLPDGVDRIRTIGNAVVPQEAEWIGHRIMEFQFR